MKISAGDADSCYYFVYDIDNDCFLEFVIFANDDTGEYHFLPTENKGNGLLLIKKDDHGNILDHVVTNGNIKIIDIRLEKNKELCERFGKDRYLKEAN